jgi:NAD(P)-dependent dehydrogenase (short-subunit alcohol dehydrogenase family)
MKTALVTGGSGGIGKEIVLSLLKNNYNVISCGE